MDDPNKKTSTLPWKDGYYHCRKMKSQLFLIDGENLLMHPISGKPTNLLENPSAKGRWKYGNFGEAHPDVAIATGKTHYNVEMVAISGMWKVGLVLNEDGNRLTFYGLTQCVDVLEWISDEALQEYIATGDPADAMPHQYQMNPGREGKLVWLSGAPGLGKSTSGMLLARNEGYVYYEADAFGANMNPYVSTEVEEPTLAMITQQFLKGVPQDRIDKVFEGVQQLRDFSQGKHIDFEKLCNYYTSLSENIKSEQKRIGGNFAIAHAAATRKIRDHLRKILGPNVIFVVLYMSKEDQEARIRARHKNADHFVDRLIKMYDFYESAGEDEPNTIQCVITKDMSRDEVIQKITLLLKENCK